jgi:uroporphyrinogen decarboxylase
MHSCGSVVKLIPDLIDAGVDILNPVQINAAGMDPAYLKREFGKDITFWGGGVDTQRILPSGTKAEIRDHVRRNIEIFSRDGGFVFAAVHNIQSDVPLENVLTVWETFMEYRA